MDELITWKLPQELFDALQNQFRVETPDENKNFALDHMVSESRCIEVGGIYYCQKLIDGEWTVVARSQFSCPC